MKALIIAAGMGTRLSPLGPSKPLVKMLDTALILHVMEAAQQSGVTEFVVVTGYRAEPLTDRLQDYERQKRIPVHTVFNPRWKEPNGISVSAAREHLNEPFFLMMSDHLFDPQILRNFQAADLRQDTLYLGVDYQIQNHPLVDLEDVTRVQVRDHKIAAIGKLMETYNAFDTGLFRAVPELFDALEQVQSRGEQSLSAGVAELGRRGKARVFDIGPHFWVDVDDQQTYAKAKTYLTQHPHFCPNLQSLESTA